MATSKRYVPPLSKSKGSAGAAAESTRRLDDLVQDLIFTVKLGSKDKYSEFNSEKVILQYCYCFTVYINNFDKSQYAVCACYLSGVITLYSNLKKPLPGTVYIFMKVKKDIHVAYLVVTPILFLSHNQYNYWQLL